jgi:hypothetical protein
MKTTTASNSRPLLYPESEAVVVGNEQVNVSLKKPVLRFH